MIKRLFLIFITILPLCLSAQITREKFFNVSLGATWQTRKDNIFSPIIYDGIGAELRLGHERISDTWYKKFDMWGGFNDMQSRIKNGYNGSSYGIHYGLSQTWAKRIWKDKVTYQFYVGGAVWHASSMGVYLGNVNNIFSYNAPVGIAGAAYVQRPLTFFKRNWIVSSELTLPVLAYNARPSHIGLLSVDNLLKDFGIVTVNKLLSIDWRWQLDLPLSNSNRLRLKYRWYFLNDTHNGRLQMGQQGLSVEMMVNFPYRKAKTNTQ